MASYSMPYPLAATGTTGNNTHAGVHLNPSADDFAIVFVVEAAGATPTVTVNMEGTLDVPIIADGSANWVPIPFITAASAESVTAPVLTAVSYNIYYLAQAHTRFFRRIRIRTTANTNITYRAEAYVQLRN